MKFIAAFQFLTTVPLPWRHGASPEDLGSSTWAFPVVGLFIGLALAGFNWLFGLFLPSAMVNILVIVALVILTGALHLDGFADTCDGIGGHKTAEDRWRVMHDSRTGSFGVVGIVLLLLVKYIALSSVPAASLMVTLVFMPVVSRWAMVYAIFAYPYARPAGLGKIVKQRTEWLRFTVATVITFSLAVIFIPLFHLTGILLIIGIWIITMAMAAYFKSKFSGLTGDNYGAINEIAEVSVLILVVLLARFGLA